jgi:hypothetical protein
MAGDAKPVSEVENSEIADGVYKVRTQTNGAKMLQVRKDLSGEYRRFTEDDGKKIVFVKV